MKMRNIFNHIALAWTVGYAGVVGFAMGKWGSSREDMYYNYPRASINNKSAESHPSSEECLDRITKAGFRKRPEPDMPPLED